MHKAPITNNAMRKGFKLEKARPYKFTVRGDYYGWHQNHEGKWFYTVFVENGRVLDDQRSALKTALFEIAKTGLANFRFTTNQNVIVSDIDQNNKKEVETILERCGIISHTENAGAVRRNAIACVAFNTCPLALAEAPDGPDPVSHSTTVGKPFRRDW